MKTPNKIVLASGNAKKLKELSSILSDFSVSLLPQTQLNIGEAIEDGLTFVENAIKKARYACLHTKLPAIADDSGIEVDYLNGQPGIYSARYVGENANDENNLQKLLTSLSGIKDQARTARYQCVIVYMSHAEDPTPLIAQASWEGTILNQKIGNGGFGYDPIFYCPISKKSAAQMTPEEKSSISHRGKALNIFKIQFANKYGLY